MKQAKFCGIILAMIILVTTTVFAERYYVISMSKTATGLNFNSIAVEEVIGSIDVADSGVYQAVVLTHDNESLHTVHVNFAQTEYVPYSSNASRIEIRNQSQDVVFSIDVGSYSKICGDGICQNQESFENCPADCVQDNVSKNIEEEINISETIEEEEINDTLPTQEEYTPQAILKARPQKQTDWLIVILSVITVFAVIFLLIILLLIMKRKLELRKNISVYLQQGYSIQQIRQFFLNRGVNQKEVDKIIRSLR